MATAVAAAVVSFIGLTGTAATIATAVVAVGISYGVSQLTAPNVPQQQQSQEQREVQVVGGESSDRDIYGLAKVGTTLNMAQFYGDYFYIGGIICGHPIEEIVAIYYGDKPSTHPDFSDVELAVYDVAFVPSEVATVAGQITLTIDANSYVVDVAVGDDGASVRTAFLNQLVTDQELAYSVSDTGFAITIERLSGSVSGWDVSVSIDLGTTDISSSVSRVAGHAETTREDRVLYSLGDHTEADPTLVSELDFIDAPQRWTSAHKSLGKSWINVRFKRDFVNEVLGGAPQITVVVRGHNDIVDHRTGLVGYTTNPLLCFQHWLEKRFDNSAGDLIDQSAWNAQTDVCDEQVVINAAGDTQDRYSFNTVIYAHEQRGDVYQVFSDAVQGSLLDFNGQFLLRPAQFRESVISLTLDDLADGDVEYQHKPSNTSRMNKIVGTFTDPAQGFSTHDYPPVSIDDDLPEQSGNLSFVAENNGIRAQRLALLNLKLSRNSAPLTLAVKRLNIDVNVDDFVTLSMPDLGFDDAVFYVSNRVDNVDATAVLTLLPRSAEDYEWSYEDATEITTVTPIPVFKQRDELS